MANKSSTKHWDITVTGMVQGVGFRLNTKRKAKKIGINGFVRNEPDGSVYIEAEGTEDQLENFLAWCQKGPTFARVADINVEKGEVRKYGEFRIER